MKNVYKYYDTFLFLIVFCISLNVFALGKIQIHGHRGARAIYPENTLKAFQYALEQHVDTLEMDMSVTKDNVIVISHEPYMNPDICLDPHGKKITSQIAIHDLTLEQIKQYDCGTLKNPKFLLTQTPSPGERIPTLEEVFELVEKSPDPHTKKVQFNIETKIFPSYPELSPNPHQFVKMFYAIIKKHKMIQRTILQSFDDRTLLEMKKLDPRVRTSILTSDNHIDYVAVAKAANADFLSPDWEWILPEDVKKLHKNKIQVAPWTPDTPEAWGKLAQMGVDAIITDDPKGLTEFLAMRKDLNNQKQKHQEQ